MPEAEVAKRGLVKVRTIHPDPSDPNKYMHVYVVRKAGKRGGHTVAGETKDSEG